METFYIGSKDIAGIAASNDITMGLSVVQSPDEVGVVEVKIDRVKKIYEKGS